MVKITYKQIMELAGEKKMENIKYDRDEFVQRWCNWCGAWQNDDESPSVCRKCDGWKNHLKDNEKFIEEILRRWM